MLAARVPVLVYVAPGGARAASAGTYILYAGQIAAMAPATHRGCGHTGDAGWQHADACRAGGRHAERRRRGAAQSPARGSDAGDAEANKVLNDAIAYIRSLAQLRGRNVAGPSGGAWRGHADRQRGGCSGT